MSTAVPPGRDRPCRVCLLAESFAPVVGGMERQAQTLAEGLARAGIETLVITIRNPPGLPAYERGDGYDIYRIARGRSRWGAIGPVLIKLLCLRRGYDLIYVAGFRVLGIPATLVGLIAGKSVALKADSNGELSGEFFDPRLHKVGLSHRSILLRPFNWCRKALLRRADRFVAIGPSVRQEFLESGVAAARISVIPNGIDVSRFRPADPEEKESLRRRLGLPGDATIVCFAGRMVEYKGVMTLLEAWRGLIPEPREAAGGTSEALLLFLGSGGSDQANYEAQALTYRDEHALGASVRFLGDVANVEDYLRAADIFAYPTREDTFALAVLEAMACGLALITSVVGDMGEYVASGENAITISHDDPAGLREALNRLRGDDRLRSELAVAGIRTAEQYSNRRATAAHIELFRKLVGVPTANLTDHASKVHAPDAPGAGG